MNQTTFSGFGVSLEEKTQRAIELLKLYEPSALKLDTERGYYLGFSGGKDSVVIKEIARLSGVKFNARYSQTTIDPPELVRFIKEQHPDVEWKRPKRNFFKALADSHGLPTRLVRWCCEEFKERDGDGKVKILGVRTTESAARSKRWKEVTLWRSLLGGFVVAPICYWTEQEVWQFIREHNLPYCKLYNEGFKRLGCVGCPMSSRRKKEFKRWPGFEKAWRFATKKYFNARKGKLNRYGEGFYFERFKTSDEFFDWWLSDKASGISEDCLGLYDEDIE